MDLRHFCVFTHFFSRLNFVQDTPYADRRRWRIRILNVSCIPCTVASLQQFFKQSSTKSSSYLSVRCGLPGLEHPGCTRCAVPYKCQLCGQHQYRSPPCSCANMSTYSVPSLRSHSVLNLASGALSTLVSFEATGLECNAVVFRFNNFCRPTNIRIKCCVTIDFKNQRRYHLVAPYSRHSRIGSIMSMVCFGKSETYRLFSTFVGR